MRALSRCISSLARAFIRKSWRPRIPFTHETERRGHGRFRRIGVVHFSIHRVAVNFGLKRRLDLCRRSADRDRVARRATERTCRPCPSSHWVILPISASLARSVAHIPPASTSAGSSANPSSAGRSVIFKVRLLARAMAPASALYRIGKAMGHPAPVIDSLCFRMPLPCKYYTLPVIYSLRNRLVWAMASAPHRIVKTRAADEYRYTLSAFILSKQQKDAVFDRPVTRRQSRSTACI